MWWLAMRSSMSPTEAVILEGGLLLFFAMGLCAVVSPRTAQQFAVWWNSKIPGVPTSLIDHIKRPRHLIYLRVMGIFSVIFTLVCQLLILNFLFNLFT